MPYNYIQLEELKKVNLNHPDSKGINYHPISHYDAVCIARDTILSKNMEIADIQIKLNKNKRRCMVMFIIKKRKARAIIGYCFSGSREHNSYSYVGKYSKFPVIVNRIKMRLHRKNQKLSSHERYRREIKRTVSIWSYEINHLMFYYWNLISNITVSNRNYINTLFTLGRNKILPWSRLGRIDTHWSKAENKECIDFLRLAWKYAIQSSPPEFQLDQLFFVYQMMPCQIKLKYLSGNSKRLENVVDIAE